jgi:cytochrome c peroxidase
MNPRLNSSNRRSLSAVSNSFALGFAFACVTAGPTHVASAQTAPQISRPASAVWDFAPAMIEHMRKMRRYKDPARASEYIPPVIDRFRVDLDPKGAIASFQPNGATITANNAFFQDLGTNGRRCVTCHQPQNGWSVSARDVAERFERSNGTDPIFRLVDGATCPSDDVSTLRARRKAYKLLTEKGLIRIGLAIPATAEFTVTAVSDPYGCNTNPETGITKQTASQTIGILSMYRRPLPSTNIAFDSAIMWDGRESPANVDLDTGFRNQAVDATLGHAQAVMPPTPEQVDQIVKFQKGIFTAQLFDDKAKLLTDDNATAGPVALASQQFFIGINDPLGGNPNETPFTSSVFNLFQSWLNAGSRHNYGHGTPMATDELLRRVNISDVWRWNEHELDRVNEHRRSVARGEQVFNTKKIVIAGVAGLNDKLGVDHVDGFCGTCHDAPNVGNHSVKLPIDIGVPDAGDKKPPVLDIAGLPVFTLTCSNVAEGNPLKGKVYQVTDLGKAMISGKCADIGLFKGPILRGLAARAPYFHNGGAANLRDVVDFYDKRFNIGFTEREKHDLVNFLKTL